MKILISESNRDIRKLYEVILHPFQAEITFTDNAQEAEHHTAHTRYDLVFLELGYPNPDGIQAAKSLRKKHPHQPLVLVSSIPISESETTLLTNNPFIAILMKPFDIGGMKNLIRKHAGFHKPSVIREISQSHPSRLALNVAV